MGTQHSRLQKRSLRRRLSRYNLPNVTATTLPGEFDDVARPKLKASMQALSQAMDCETAEALVNETLRLTMDLQQVHQQLNEVLKTKSAESVNRRVLLPQFSFELRPVLPLLPDVHPAHRVGELQLDKMTRNSTQAAAHLSLCSGRCSSTASYHSTRSASDDQVFQFLPALTASSSCYSCSASSMQSLPRPPPPGTMFSCLSDTALEILHRHDSILGPAIALCDELLDQSLDSLALSADEVELGLRRGRKGELPINPVGGPEDGRIIAVRSF
ncbi:hypothetical protein Slin15195_G048940 [Septoria linicola]|uniref:Uncharacterized protein n=1 Tax=Septoria linicola TaxID=215465 RepID=A0A9Q9AM96_9PEZI|nr:hypothetical protein Slin15195_G048940 [Septoria linicola]